MCSGFKSKDKIKLNINIKIKYGQILRSIHILFLYKLKFLIKQKVRIKA